METIEIKKSDVQVAYAVADEKTRRVLVGLFGDDVLPVTERIKTFEDAMSELDSNHPLLSEYRVLCAKPDDISPDLLAYIKLRIIVAALNERWEPEFIKDECHYYPCFYLYTQMELDNMEDSVKKGRRMIDTSDYQTEYVGFSYVCPNCTSSITATSMGSHLCLRTKELATYCGKQFIKLWADYSLIRK